MRHHAIFLATALAGAAMAVPLAESSLPTGPLIQAREDDPQLVNITFSDFNTTSSFAPISSKAQALAEFLLPQWCAFCPNKPCQSTVIVDFITNSVNTIQSTGWCWSSVNIKSWAPGCELYNCLVGKSWDGAALQMSFLRRMFVIQMDSCTISGSLGAPESG